MSRSVFILCLNARRLPITAHWAPGWSVTPREDGRRPVRQPAALREPALHRPAARHRRRIARMPRPERVDHGRGGLAPGEARLGLLPERGPGIGPGARRAPTSRACDPGQMRPQRALPPGREASRGRPDAGEARHEVPARAPGEELGGCVLAAQPDGQPERQGDPGPSTGPGTHADGARRELPQPPRLVEAPSHDLTVTASRSRLTPSGVPGVWRGRAVAGFQLARGVDAKWRDSQRALPTPRPPGRFPGPGAWPQDGDRRGRRGRPAPGLRRR